MIMDEIYSLIEKAQGGGESALSEVVARNLGLVHSVARRFQNRGCEYDDLIQIGSIGLIKAVKKFDLSLGVRFSTYAVPMIMGEIKRFLRDDGPIKVSRSLKELSAKAMRLREVETAKNGREPSVAELAKMLDVTPAELAAAIESSARPESLYAAACDLKGDMKPLIDRIECPTSFENEVEDRLTIENLLGSFPPRERLVIVQRYFGHKTQAQVAEMLGVSQVQISRIEKRVLLEMRQKLLGEN